MQGEASKTAESNSINRLFEDVSIEGKLEFNKSLEFNGSLKGEIHSNGNLVVGKNGSIEGEVSTRSIVVFGKIKGNVTVEEKCDLKASCHVDGDIKASLLSMDEDAEFSGSCYVSRKK